MELTSFISYIARVKRYSRHTVIAYETDLNQFAVYCEEEYEVSDAKEVTFQMVRSWVAMLMADLSAKSINRKISALKSYYKYLLREGVVDKNPAEKVEGPKLKKNLPNFVDQVKMDNLLDSRLFDGEFSGVRDRVLISLLYHTGIRLSELIGLKDGDLDLGSSTIKVLGKRNKERMIPLTVSFVNELTDYVALRRKEYPNSTDLFCTNSGEKVYPKFAYRIVNSYLSKVSTQRKRSPHVLRHTFATHMLNNGADLNTIKEILGHANLSATQVYTHNTFEKLKSIYKQAHPRA